MIFIKYNAEYLWMCYVKKIKAWVNIKLMLTGVLKMEDGGWDYEGHIRDHKFDNVIRYVKIKEIL